MSLLPRLAPGGARRLGEVDAPRRDEHRLVLGEVRHGDEPALDRDLRAVAAVGRRPPRAADRRRTEAPAGAEVTVPVAPELALGVGRLRALGRLLAGRGGLRLRLRLALALARGGAGGARAGGEVTAREHEVGDGL